MLLLIGLWAVPVPAQDLAYSNLKDLMNNQGEEVAGLRVEKRTKNQITLTGGADYKVMVNGSESMSKNLKKRTFAVRTSSGKLYINCRKLRYKKMRFGAWYAPAVRLGDKVYFCAVPLGSVVGGHFVETDDAKLGGKVGDAIAASSLVSKRVCYELNGATGKIEFLGKEKMEQLLADYPSWLHAYTQEGGQEAQHTFKYLLMLEHSQ